MYRVITVKGVIMFVGVGFREVKMENVEHLLPTLND